MFVGNCLEIWIINLMFFETRKKRQNLLNARDIRVSFKKKNEKITSFLIFMPKFLSSENWAYQKCIAVFSTTADMRSCEN